MHYLETLQRIFQGAALIHYCISLTFAAYKCPYVAPPKHGFVTCDSETERQFCSVYCDQGYEFVFKPDALYRCKQTKQGGHWSTFSKNHRFPWPDCAGTSFPSNRRIPSCLSFRNFCARLNVRATNEPAVRSCAIARWLLRSRTLPAGLLREEWKGRITSGT